MNPNTLLLPTVWPRAEPTTVVRCVVLAVLVHLWLVLLLGSAPGGTAQPGQGVWGAINVTLRGPTTAQPPAPQAPQVLTPPAGGPPGAATTERFGGAVRAAEPEPAAEPGAAQLGDWRTLPAPSEADARPAARTPLAETLPLPVAPAAPTLPLAPLRMPDPVPAPPAAADLPPTPAVERTLAREAPVARPRSEAAALPLAPAATPAAAPRLPELNAPAAAPLMLPRLAPPTAPSAVAPLAPSLPLQAAPSTPSLPAAPTLAPVAPLRQLPMTAPPQPREAAAPLSSEPARLAAPREPELPSMPNLQARDVAPAAAVPAAPAPAAALAPPVAAPPAVVAPSPQLVAPPPPAVPGPATPGDGMPAADAGSRVGHDVATAPSAPASTPRLNLQLNRPRGGELSRGMAGGALPVLPRPPEVDDKLGKQIEKAAKGDCRTAYAAAGVLAVVPLAIEAVRKDSGCKW